jgi:hypothetical protein
MRTRWAARLAFRWLAALLVLAGVTIGLSPAAGASATSCQGWISELPQPVASGTVANDLTSVTTVSACDVFVAGTQEFTGATTALAEHWDGTQWSVTPTPFLPSDHLHVASIHGDASNDVWAVGGFRDSQGIDQALIMHYDGSSWTQVPSPSPSSDFNDLTSVHAVSADDAWAVGTFDNGTADRTLILHWNGTVWQQVLSPSPGGPGSNDELFGVTATSASDAWAVGNVEAPTGNETSLILHWNGLQWTRKASPHPGTNSPLLAVDASSATNAWAVGNTSNGGLSQTFALHWNGSKWAGVATPSPANPGSADSLRSVAVASTSNAWAVEGVNGILHWDGHTWTVVDTPQPPGAISTVLNAVASTPAGSAWSVGVLNNGSPPSQPYAIHCC